MKTPRSIGVVLAVLAASFHPAAAAEPSAPEPAPNFVMILVDDLGWQDVKCYDIDEPSPVETPNIDALAKRGILFREAYSPAPSCTPSRCAIMSGVHPARSQTTHVAGGTPPAGPRGAAMLSPWFSGRMPAEELTLAKLLRQNGYATGHAGKWHMAADHFAFPGPTDQGFDFTTHRSGYDVRGVQTGMKNRLQGFATSDPGDPYRLDEEGFPTDPVTSGALEFMADNKDKPFFLYYATWLVHGPIQSRSKALLEKYCRKLGAPYPENPEGWGLDGQRNPYYCAMVETLDHYVGKLVEFLEETDDPRNPGRKLIDNTYVFFTSDNGGAEGVQNEVVTDNSPLDKGKTSPKEGGVRVPFVVTGPGIPAGRESDVVVNGIDFYPTIAALAGLPRPEGKQLDGANLVPLLTGDPGDAALVRGPDGQPRGEMIWHYPHGGSTSYQSTIRAGDFKLIKNHDLSRPATPEFELYRLYRTQNGTKERVDIEEAKNLAASMPDKVAELDARLMASLGEMKATFPHYNPDFTRELPGKDKVPSVTGQRLDGRRVELDYRENGARVVRADIIYSTNGSRVHEEWFRLPADLPEAGKVTATLPADATHYFVGLVDENDFLVSYPVPAKQPADGGKPAGFAPSALPADSAVKKSP
ncbi:MAG: sulfatase [Chthoniobacterales bacterium]|jgi:arylsulfatase A-like enzyme